MSGLFGKKTTINNDAPRIGAVRVQSSTQGIPIAIVYGMTRVSPNLLQYTDFLATPQTTSQKSGKGGGGVTTVTTTYSYQAAVMLGLSEGPLPNNGTTDMIGTAWVDKQVTSGANLALTEFRGTYAQAGWSFMAAQHPADGRSLRGQAYVARSDFPLSTNAGLPNLSFELRGLLWQDDCEPDINVGRLLPDLLSNVNYGALYNHIGALTDMVAYCEAAGFKVSPNYNEQRPASEMVAELCKIANSAPFWSEGVLKASPYADQIVTRTPFAPLPGTDSYTEDLNPANFSVISGNSSLFTYDSGTYGNQVTIASQNSANIALMRHTVSSHAIETFTVKFIRNNSNTDDAASMVLKASGNAALGIVPQREQGIDTFKRPYLSLPEGLVLIGTTELPLHVWFTLNVNILPGVDASTYALIYTANGVSFNSGTIHTDYAGLNYNQVDLTADSSGLTSSVTYACIATTAGIGACALGNTPVTYTPNLTIQYDLSTANATSGGSDFISAHGDPPIKVKRTRQADAYNVIQVSCLDRSDAYNKAVVEASDLDLVQRFGRRVAPVIQAEMICSTDTARAVAQTALQRSVYLRNTYEFTVGWRYSRLEPMDLVTLTDAQTQLAAKPVRITAVQENDSGALDMEAEDLFIGVSTPGAYQQQSGSGYTTNTGIDPGNANATVVFQPPTELSGTPQIWIGASGGPDWGGAEIWGSDDGTTFARVGIITAPARYGVVTANWPASADPDTTGNLAVSLANSGGDLTSATQLQANGGDTLSYVGANGSGELIAYTTANLTGTHNYSLTSYIRRGLYCSFSTAHLVGESFMRLDGAVAKVDIDAGRVGHTLHYKLRSFNQVGGGLQDLSTAIEFSYVVQPLGIVVTNGVVPSTIQAGELLCVPEGTQYQVLGRMKDYGRINLHGRLIVGA